MEENPNNLKFVKVRIFSKQGEGWSQKKIKNLRDAWKKVPIGL